MVLAAGLGTCVRPLTKKTPKPMAPILGKPLLEFLIEHLAHHGIRGIMINVEFNHCKIENHFGGGRPWGGLQSDTPVKAFAGMGTLCPAPWDHLAECARSSTFEAIFDDTNLVTCGDAIIDLDICTALHEHGHKRALVSVVTSGVQPDQDQKYGVVVADADSRVRSFRDKPREEEARSTAASTGIPIFEPGVLDLVPKGRPFDIGSELPQMLVERDLPFCALKWFFNWIDIGRLSDYWIALQRVFCGELANMEMPGKQLRPRVWVGRTALSTGTAYTSRGRFTLAPAFGLKQAPASSVPHGSDTKAAFTPTAPSSAAC